MRRIAECNDIDPDPDAGDDRPPRPADPVGSFLHGLLTFDSLFASGGLRVTDSSTGVAFLPGCCNGLEEWRVWYEVIGGGGPVSFGHDPDAIAELSGDAVRLTVDAEQDNSPVIYVPTSELLPLLKGVERDLTAFLVLAADWSARHLPERAVSVAAALARALALPEPVLPSSR
ncbi:hypothetical protein [Streptomyces sp. NPDC093795]|uniref:hypothetical protein n=1 Tax=Streptomyces sp. NPDC093795 TaxID=3366051 RepID=UPI003802F79D